MASSPIFRRGLPPALVCLFVAACGTQLRDVDRTPSRSLEKVPTSGIAGRVESAARSHPGKSGFAVLEGNREAFADRIALADFAQKTLDVQYYIWSADTAGLMLADHLIQAADRGVRVRFLVDDVNFKNRDSSAANLAAHPNIEVRIFNPHHTRSLRVFEFLGDFGRLNRRMHNKVMVMDNACAIIGGRNIADQYFGLNEDFNNRDLDIAAVGPIVRDISKTFDEFWNSPASVPIEAFVKEDADMDDFRAQLATMRSNIHPERIPVPIHQDVATLRRNVDQVVNRMVWAEGEVVYDPYETWSGENPEGKMSHRLLSEVASARKDVRIEEAYFVVRDRGIETIRSLTNRGVKVRVLTNALAGNDVVAAQAGHAKRLPQVIGAGAEVYELRPDAEAIHSQVAPHARNSRAALHTKAFVIDGRTSFVGSFNLDPRSADINSEIGLLVRSEALAAQVGAFLDEGVRPENAYHVTLDDRGRPIWTTTVNGETKTWTHDPETTFTRRMMNQILTWLPIENQL